MMFAGHRNTLLRSLSVGRGQSNGLPANAGEEPWRKRELASTLSDAWAALIGIGAAAFVGSVFAGFWLAEVSRASFQRLNEPILARRPPNAHQVSGGG
jgi:hypothetical protein